MRIETSYRAAASSRSAPRGGDGGAFQVEGRTPGARATAPAPASALHGLDALLALQAVDDPLLRRRKAVRRGRSLLDTLEGLKADLLAGQLGEGRLNQLLAVIGQAREQADPGLDALIDDIELRARVELAKRGVFPAF